MAGAWQRRRARRWVGCARRARGATRRRTERAEPPRSRAALAPRCAGVVLVAPPANWPHPGSAGASNALQGELLRPADGQHLRQRRGWFFGRKSSNRRAATQSRATRGTAPPQRGAQLPRATVTALCRPNAGKLGSSGGFGGTRGIGSATRSSPARRSSRGQPPGTCAATARPCCGSLPGASAAACASEHPVRRGDGIHRRDARSSSTTETPASRRTPSSRLRRRRSAATSITTVQHQEP